MFNIRHLIMMTALICLSLATRGADKAQAETVYPPDKYDVVWDTPSKDHNGSMPLGNGDIGLNAWIEENGDLIFYISKTDSWDDNGRLLKVGKVRIRLDPDPLRSFTGFKQTLHLVDGMMNVQYGTGDSSTTLRLWVDANHPAIYVEINGNRKVGATASIELWRTERNTLQYVGWSDVLHKSPSGEPTITEPDSVLTNQNGRIGWYHRNIKSVGPEICAKIQGIQGFKRPDPLLHRTFGAVITAKKGKRVDDLHLQSSSSTSHRFSIYVLTEHPATLQQWLQAVDKVIAASESISFDKRLEAHKHWWREFWTRSWIHVNSTEAKQDDAFVVSRAYALQRYVSACSGRGRYPIKANGSIFTVPWYYPGEPVDADYRRWGPGYWWMGTRLAYWPMLASGDFDMMKPLFHMYGKDLMPLFKYRTRRHVDHDGAYMPECIYFWGDIFSDTYGWKPFEERTDKLQELGYHKYHWVPGLELVFMMLDYYEYTLDNAFLRDMVLPTAHEILTFFDQQYKTDRAGKLVMHPAQALETWWDCTNPMPELAGLHAVTDRLLSLEKKLTTSEQRTFWTALKRKLPDLPTREVNGKTMFAPAEKFANKMNSENPELYAVFPFRLGAVGKPGMDLGIEALNDRWDKGNISWRQDDIFMAYLGLADQAREYMVGRARKKDSSQRFPVFCGPNDDNFQLSDWMPDQQTFNNLLTTLQAMLIQIDGRKIYILPAWPKDWDVDFKLHAPYGTVVEGIVKNGKLVKMNIYPEARKKDVIVMEPK